MNDNQNTINTKVYDLIYHISSYQQGNEKTY
jgi:hypothetical protein